MNTITILLVILGVLLLMSAFFSGSETALMRLNPYRLKTLARRGHLGARLAYKLLQRPDRLIGLILAGNNAVNVAASAITTVIALRLGGEAYVALGGAILLFVVLIFAEVAPKTVAALYPEKVAFPAAVVYYPLLIVSYPLVWTVNTIANGLLRLIGIRTDIETATAMNREELHLAVSEASGDLPQRRQAMLLRVLELERVTVEDIMVPRAEIVGLDLDETWEQIVAELRASQHTRLPVYHDSLDEVVGILHLRHIVKSLTDGTLDRDDLDSVIRAPYFVPEDTPLNKQLVAFQASRKRMGLVVDEYGDLQGLVTLDDLLEEIVGEFTTVPVPANESVDVAEDGSFIVRGSANIRALNRSMGWMLPDDGPKTLNGLILEATETIPRSGARFEIEGYPMTVLRTGENVVYTVSVRPREDEESESV